MACGTPNIWTLKPKNSLNHLGWVHESLQNNLTRGGGMQVGEATIEWSAESFQLEGQSASGVNQPGSVKACQISLRDGALLEAGYTTWANGERDIRVYSRLSGPEIYDRLIKGARMGVHVTNAGIHFAELRILSQHADKQPTMVKAHLDNLDQMIEGSVTNMLMKCGAEKIGTRETILSDTSRRKQYLAVSFQNSDFQTPMVAYVITRILPLFKGFGNVAPIPVGQA